MELMSILGFISKQLQITFVLCYLILYLLLNILPTLLLLSLWKLLVWISARAFRPDLGPFLSRTESAFALSTKASGVSILLLYMLDGELELERLRHLFQARILDLKTGEKGLRPYEKLTKFWTSFGGCAFWKIEKSFDIKDHVRLYDAHLGRPDLAIPVPFTEEDIGKLGGKLAALPWREGKSPWEVLYLAPEDDGAVGGRSAVFIRTDHVIGDGYSLLELCRKLFDTPMEIPGLQVKSRNRKSRLDGFLNAIKFLYDYAELTLKDLKIKKHKRTPDPAGGGVAGNKHESCVSGEIPVETIKTIKNHYGVSYASVLNSVIQGAVAKCLEEAGLSVPKALSVSVILPLPNHPGGLCNHATGIVLDLPCEATSAQDRLLRVDESLKSLKNTKMASVGFKILPLISSLCPLPLRSYLCYSTWDQLDYCVSNFPVIKDSPSCDGITITNMLVFLSEVRDSRMMVFGGGLNNKQRFYFVYAKGQFGLDASTFSTHIGMRVQEEVEALLLDAAV